VDRPGDAEQWLASLLLLPGVPHEWIQEAHRLQILALTQQDRFNEAESLAEVHSKSSLDEVLASVQLLNDKAEIASELERKFIGRLQTHLVKNVGEHIKSLPDLKKLDWDLALIHIELNLASNREIFTSIDRLQQLRKLYPRDARIAELLGLCYLQTERYQSALSVWRALIEGSKEGTRLWFRAKLNLVTSLRRSGQPDQAREVLELVEVLYPELGGPALRQQFRSEHQILMAEK
jgi:tetratricopeptide (TPR) repeat protein